MSTQVEPKFLNEDQLSERWGGQIKPRTLANWRSQGVGPTFRRIGGRVLYAIEDVIAYEEASAAGSTRDYRAR